MIEPMKVRVADLSHHNTVALWRLRENGVSGLIHKATQGRTFVDARFTARNSEAATVDLLFGSYHFGTDEPARDQADHFLNVTGLDGLKALDIEGNDPHTMTRAGAEIFVLRIQEKTGRWPGLYSGLNFLNGLARGLNPESPLLLCWLWIARYGTRPPEPPAVFGKTWTFWQYTDKEEKLGIDMSRFNGSPEILKRFWNGEDGPERSVLAEGVS